jgi:multiple sugar transport system ATP-binding protein
VAELRLVDLHVRYPGAEVDALAGVDLTVPNGSRTVLIGGSGSGKTTLLRAVAGLAPVVHGRILLDGRDVTGLSPGDRDVAMVRQEGSLFPHLDVRGNLGFGLQVRQVPPAEVDRRVDAEARAFNLTRLLGRRPATLAAGERHEVALARSLVRRGAVLLLDEPFARVDAHRRADLRRELLRIQAGYGVTTVLTTNDPVTALVLGDQVAVVHDGRLQQVGPPLEVAEAPASIAVADAVVVPAMNLVPGVTERRAGRDVVVAGPLRIALRRPCPLRHVTVGVRPGRLELGGDGPVVPVRRRVFLGAEEELVLGVPGQPELRVTTVRGRTDGLEATAVRVRPADVHLFDPVSGAAVRRGA